MTGTGDVPTRYCNQCGQEEHGTAGCETHRYESIIVPEQRLRIIAGIPYALVDAIPPGAKPFRLKEQPNDQEGE